MKMMEMQNKMVIMLMVMMMVVVVVMMPLSVVKEVGLREGSEQPLCPGMWPRQENQNALPQ